MAKRLFKSLFVYPQSYFLLNISKFINSFLPIKKVL